jgi:predicted nucleic acid-binding protein
VANVDVKAYLEASAAAKLLVEEAESVALARWLDERTSGGDVIVSSLLLEPELRRLAIRAGIAQERVTDVLDRLDLVEPDPLTYRTAGLLEGRDLRSLDALHVAACLRASCDVMISYDLRQAAAAKAAGLHVVAPA